MQIFFLLLPVWAHGILIRNIKFLILLLHPVPKHYVIFPYHVFSSFSSRHCISNLILIFVKGSAVLFSTNTFLTLYPFLVSQVNDFSFYIFLLRLITFLPQMFALFKFLGIAVIFLLVFLYWLMQRHYYCFLSFPFYICCYIYFLKINFHLFSYCFASFYSTSTLWRSSVHSHECKINKFWTWNP